jgi:hypothetical protein
MDKSFSPVIFLYGMVAVGGLTLLIWRTLPKPRPPLRHGASERLAFRLRKRLLVSPRFRRPPKPFQAIPREVTRRV